MKFFRPDGGHVTSTPKRLLGYLPKRVMACYRLTAGLTFKKNCVVNTRARDGDVKSDFRGRIAAPLPHFIIYSFDLYLKPEQGYEDNG